MGDFTLTIKGFKSKEQVEELAYWYSEEGEQFLSEWLKCYENIDSMNVDCKKMLNKWNMQEGESNLDLYLEVV